MHSQNQVAIFIYSELHTFQQIYKYDLTIFAVISRPLNDSTTLSTQLILRTNSLLYEVPITSLQIYKISVTGLQTWTKRTQLST